MVGEEPLCSGSCLVKSAAGRAPWTRGLHEGTEETRRLWWCERIQTIWVERDWARHWREAVAGGAEYGQEGRIWRGLLGQGSVNGDQSKDLNDCLASCGILRNSSLAGKCHPPPAMVQVYNLLLLLVSLLSRESEAYLVSKGYDPADTQGVSLMLQEEFSEISF